jgi:hypothetical protein
MSVYPSPPGGPQVAGPVVNRLQSWIMAPKSQLLWIMDAPYSPTSTSDSFLAASHIVALASSKGFLHLSFMCQRQVPPGYSEEEQSKARLSQMVSLLYSLVRQLAMMVPPRFDESFDLTTAFDSMDGSEQSLETALELMEVLLKHAPKVLLCVIDGLEILDHYSNQPYLDRMIQILQPKDSLRVVKVLLTTRGRITSGSKFGIDEILDCTRLPAKRLGKPRLGGRDLHGVRLPENGP